MRDQIYDVSYCACAVKMQYTLNKVNMVNDVSAPLASVRLSKV